MPESGGSSPTLRRRRLSALLRELRDAREMTAEEVAGRLKWGKNKPLYLESGQGVRPDPHDIERLADLYGVKPALKEELVRLAEAAREKGWWHPYIKQLSRPYTTLIGLELEAAEIQVFESSVLHGLLQTRDYAEALVLGGGPSKVSAADVESRVKVRLERQRILRRDDPARLTVILDEAAIRRKVGGSDVMQAQLQHLLELMHAPNITIRVMPFNAGAHPGVAGSFTLLRFADAADTPAVYVETVAGEFYVEETDEVKAYSSAFEVLASKVLGPEDTIAVIAAAAATM